MERKRSWRLGMGHGRCAVLHKIVILAAAVMFSAATIAFAQSTLPDRQTDENSSRDVTQPQGKIRSDRDQIRRRTYLQSARRNARQHAGRSKRIQQGHSHRCQRDRRGRAEGVKVQWILMQSNASALSMGILRSDKAAQITSRCRLAISRQAVESF